jgi:hypothetical protein
MPRGKKFTAEQIIGKLREAEVGLAQGKTVPEVVRKLGVTEQTYYRWTRKSVGHLVSFFVTSYGVLVMMDLSPRKPAMLGVVALAERLLSVPCDEVVDIEETCPCLAGLGPLAGVAWFH